MVADRLGALGKLRTLDAMTAAFADEDRCRDVLEALVWPNGVVCPFCNGRNCRRRGGQDYAKGRWRCGEGACRASFTVTSRTLLHATKLSLSVWLKGLWLVLWSDKGVSSPRLAECLGVTQATAWLLGHRLRLLMRHLNQPLDGTVEADLLHVGGKPRFDPAQPEARQGKQGHTTKRPVLTAVARPEDDRARRGRCGPRARRRRRGPRPGPGDAGRARGAAADRSGCSLRGARQGARSPRDREPFGEGVRPGRRAREHGGSLARPVPTNHRRRLSSCRAGARPGLPRGDRVPLAPAGPDRHRRAQDPLRQEPHRAAVGASRPGHADARAVRAGPRAAGPPPARRRLPARRSMSLAIS